MTIRKAEKIDSLGILALMKQLIDEHQLLDDYYKPFSAYHDLRKYIQDSLANRNKIVLVAEEKNKIIGYFIGEIEPAPFYSTEKKIGVVADTCVNENRRRQGILKDLFKEASKWFSKKGVNYVELSVQAKNIGAIIAWKKSGFSVYRLRMRKKIKFR